MKTMRTVTCLWLAVILAGCWANLTAVREYACESAKLSAYTDLTRRFRDTYEREEPYLLGKADSLAKENDKRRKAASDDLLRIHQRVSLYMQTLATLAGDETFDISKEIGGLAGGIAAYPAFGIDQKHVNALSNLSKTISRWITSSSQERAVREMIREGDPPLQTSLDGMLTLVRYYRETHENEKKMVLGFFEVEIPFADAPKDRLLAILARAHVQAKTVEYNNAQSKYLEAEKGIKAVAEGHKKLLDNIDRLSADDARALVLKAANDIKAIRVSLQEVAD